MMQRRSLIGFALLMLIAISQPAHAHQAAQHSAAHAAAPPLGDLEWWKRRPLVIDNSKGTVDLRDYQVRVPLYREQVDPLNTFKANADIRFTDDDGYTLLPYWIEDYFSDGSSLVAWVRVPLVKAGAQKTIYIYYQNRRMLDGAYPVRVFDFYDDFGDVGTGYFELSPPRTVMTKTQEWESAAPHTLSVVELNRDGYRYWGYYGLTNCGGIGLVRSNDLANWDKYEQNPVVHKDGERWASVVKDGDTLYMVHTRDYCTTSHLVLRTSRDGVDFGAPDDYTLLVAPEKGIANQNPALFYDETTRTWYLYWYRGGHDYKLWQIMARSASTPAGLATADNHILISEKYEIAAPHMMRVGDTYYLSTEVNENAWKTRIYAGEGALGVFTPLPGNPVLGNNEACFFQHVFSNTLHAYYCKDNGDEWVVNYRTANLSAGRMQQRKMDDSKWDTSQAGWSIAADGADPNRATVLTGKSAQESFTWSSAYTGKDYVVELNGRLADGELWSIGVRAEDDRRMLRLDVHAGSPARMSLSRWENGAGTLLDEATLGGVDAGQWFSLTVTLHGAAIETRVNGIPGARGQDAQFTEGRVTLIAPAGSTALFDNVRVRKYAAAAPSVLTQQEERSPTAGTSWLWSSLTEPQPSFIPPDEPPVENTGLSGDAIFVIAIGALTLVLAGGAGFVLWRRRRHSTRW